MEFSSPAPLDVFPMSAPSTLAPACGGGRVAAMKTTLIALLAFLGGVYVVGAEKKKPQSVLEQAWREAWGVRQFLLMIAVMFLTQEIE